jgi:[ribosomal protein S5]-alanine N-acetyltransferase
MSTQLETGRLLLVPFTADVIAVIEDDPAAAERLIGARLPPEWPDAELAELLSLYAARLAADASLVGYGPWALVRRDERRVVGSAGFLGPPRDGAIELGFGVQPQDRNRGYATEAAQALVRWALGRPNVDKIVARCEADNLASIRVLQNAGLRRAGEADGRLLWRLARTANP